MKKMVLLPVLLAACTSTTDTNNGLNRLNTEPKDCKFLYTLDSSVSNYKIADAYNFVEKQIIEHDSIGDSYYIASSKEVENPGAIFGPKYTYKMKVKVYNYKK